jgi:hypothetical protein
MPTIEEIRRALGKMDKSSVEPSREVLNENVNPFTEKLFAPVEQLQHEIKDKDKIIESLRNESTELMNKVSIVEKEKSVILEELEKSRWLENKVTLATKKVYEDKVKSVINENVDSKIIPILTAVARRKQGNQHLNWGNWLKIPENGYLFQVNKDIAKKIFEDTNALIPKKRTRGGGGKVQESVNYSLSFTGNSDVATRTYDYVTTDFNPDDYDLHLGCTVSYWVKPDEIGNTMFAFGRKHSANERFVFGINRQRQGYFAIGRNKTTTSWVNMDTPLEEELLEQSGQYWNLRTDMWYHMVLTYDDRVNADVGTDRRIYVNGVLRDTDNINWNETGGSTGGMYFGCRNVSDAYQNGWACKLDEVSIFNTAKDATWVSNAYNSGTPTDLQGESGIVGYWKFNEGSGTTIKDHSGNGNHGTFGAISGNTTAYPTWSTNTP